MAEKKKMDEMNVTPDQTEGVNGAELLEAIASAEGQDSQEEMGIAGEMLEGDAILSGLVLSRELIASRDKKGKFAVYNVHGKIRGKEVKAGFIPPDKGGYNVLDLVYGDATGLPLWMVPYEMVDEKTRAKISGFTYKVMTTDEDGITLECKVKPSRDSDKRLLECLLQIVKLNA